MGLLKDIPWLFTEIEKDNKDESDVLPWMKNSRKNNIEKSEKIKSELEIEEEKYLEEIFEGRKNESVVLDGGGEDFGSGCGVAVDEDGERAVVSGACLVIGFVAHAALGVGDEDDRPFVDKANARPSSGPPKGSFRG